MWLGAGVAARWAGLAGRRRTRCKRRLRSDDGAGLTLKRVLGASSFGEVGDGEDLWGSAAATNPLSTRSCRSKRATHQSRRGGVWRGSVEVAPSAPFTLPSAHDQLHLHPTRNRMARPALGRPAPCEYLRRTCMRLRGVRAQKETGCLESLDAQQIRTQLAGDYTNQHPASPNA
eukprot:330937-Chlamydomonas_euryale.AAC.7